MTDKDELPPLDELVQEMKRARRAIKAVADAASSAQREYEGATLAYTAAKHRVDRKIGYLTGTDAYWSDPDR